VLITAESVSVEFDRGARRIAAPRGTSVITPGAWTKALELGITFDQGATAEPGPSIDARGGERVTDASGVIVVRGATVRLERFAPAGAGRNVGLADVVTGKDRSPMTAGFMRWSHEDAFPWRLDYDEIDYVIEGVLHVQIAGRTVEGRAGDVVYIPKGSQIIFGTPNRVHLFYVTYPADWAGAPK
jgi:ethanolamine utilization protein EutQ